MTLIATFLRSAISHPAYSLGVGLALAWFISFSFVYFATAEELSQVRTTVVSLRTSIDRNALEAQVHAYEAEIFDLERIVDSGDARDRDYERLSALRSDLGTAKRKLERLQ